MDTQGFEPRAFHMRSDCKWKWVFLCGGIYSQLALQPAPNMYFACRHFAEVMTEKFINPWLAMMQTNLERFAVFGSSDAAEREVDFAGIKT
eukprot:4375212-Amphidinium_carterae.1